MSGGGSAAVGSNLGNDFDNSDDDIADLLTDDDDDVYAKKVFGNTPTKKTTTKTASFSPQKNIDKSIEKPSLSRKNSETPFLSLKRNSSAEYNSNLNSSPKHISSKKNSLTSENDAISEFLKKNSSTPKSSPSKRPSDQNESNYIDELGFSKLSSKTTSFITDTDLGFSKEDFNLDDDDDILKTLESDEEDESFKNSARKKDFLQAESSVKKHEDGSKELGDSTRKGKGDINEDLQLENPKMFIPGEHLQKRKESLKQVSFKNSPEHFSKTKESLKEKPTLEKPLKQISDLKGSELSLSSSKRLEKMGASKDDDMDWSTFFIKESPKKNKDKNIVMTKKDNVGEIPISDALSQRRKSSSAEWLGLNEPNTPSKTDSLATERENKKDGWLVSGEGIDSLRSFSAKEPINKSRRPRVAPTVDTNWLKDDFPSTSKAKDKSEDTFKTEPSTKLPENQLDLETFQDKTVKYSLLKEKKDALNEVNNNKIFTQHSRKENVNEPFAFSAEIPSQITENLLPNHKVTTHQVPNLQQNLPQTALPFSSIAQSDVENMKNMLNNYLLERDHLLKSSETMKTMYEERMKTIENLHRDEVKSLEDFYKTSENNLRKEMENKVQIFENKMSDLVKEKEATENDLKIKLSELKKEHSKEIQKLKELHSISVSQMKQDHEDALKRLSRLKDQEVEAVLSTQAHTRSLEHLADLLEARTSELAMLQTKVEERNQSTLREKQALLENKEKELKSLQSRLQRQLEDGEEEKTRLQQLVLRLENRLQKSTTEGEEDRWEVQQMKARLKVQQKYLDEEHKLKIEQIEREKEKLQMSQNSLLQEQKVVLLQLAQERQQLTQEKNDLELRLRKITEEESKFNLKKLKEESYIERQKQYTVQEERRLQSENINLKQENQQLERDRDMLEREKQQFLSEKERFNEFSLKIKRRADEVEQLAWSANEEKEKARLEMSTAIKIKSEHQSKLQQIAEQMQTLMEKEHQILQEKEKIAEEKCELERKKNSMMCMKCKLSTQLPLNVSPPNINTTPVTVYPYVNGISNNMPQTFVDPNLFVYRVFAQKDHAFLEEELSYLKSLKESSKTEIKN